MYVYCGIFIYEYYDTRGKIYKGKTYLDPVKKVGLAKDIIHNVFFICAHKLALCAVLTLFMFTILS